MLDVQGILSRKPFSVVAHRGASGYEPENTLRAFRRAIDMGADMIEADVRLSKDGIPVVIHDESLDRTIGVHGFVRDYTVDELRGLDTGLGEKIPLLSETLELVRDRIGFILEVKEVEASLPSLEMVEEMGMMKQVLFASFHVDVLKTITSSSRKAYLCLIYSKPGGQLLEARGLGCIAVAPHYRLLSEKSVGLAHRLGLKINAWTIDDVETASRIAEIGVDAITTNKPDIILSLRELYISR
ncbi:MAG: glycerophosphodiester phosphodiesterase [Nitrososphaerota archaeon]|nr:glycerophosphodiester phosphodiesterase [Candidatus Bathyarchaeota archaeon]MDW8061986.1 glycerophosphodiester phosphodiesterase [Nitrososphaerota archaeon]